MKLTNLAGNPGLKQQLKGLVKLPHACIIAGPEGSGRHTFARLLAQAMVCSQKQLEDRPCGHCRSCRKVAENIHPDVIWIDRFTGPEKSNAEVKVAAARALRQDAYIRPNEGERKVYLIDRPMNGNAQNALLKLLEDGPEYAAFLILTENAASLLETVRSRCVLYQMTPVTEDERQKSLQQAPDQEIKSTAEKTAALKWADRFVQALCTGDELALMEWAVTVQQEKLTREELDSIYGILTQVLVQALTSSRDADASTQALAQTLSRDKLVQLARLTEQARVHFEFNVSVGHSAGWFAVRSRQILLGEWMNGTAQYLYPALGGL